MRNSLALTLALAPALAKTGWAIFENEDKLTL
jgi:hypothetical protein